MKFMRAAVREAEKNLKTLAGGPFGACVVKNGRVIALAHNTVLKDQDPTAHAEINAIRKAAKKLGTFDLTGCEIYSTTEPCPMCFSAIPWARIGKIYFGTSTRDAARACFNELVISDAMLKKIGKSSIRLVPGFGLRLCQGLFRKWGKLAVKEFY